MDDPYLAGLRMLARRDLSEAQLRLRLARRGFERDHVETTVARLRGDGALDDRRTALACARREAHVKRHGRLRALRQLEALGIARDVAAAAVREVFADVNEDALLAHALDTRLRRSASIDRAALARVRRQLQARGFEADRVNAALRHRVKSARHDE